MEQQHSRWGRFLCWLTNHHKWDKKLDDIPASSIFHRIDCQRCGESVDGAAARRLRDQVPILWRSLGKRLPQ